MAAAALLCVFWLALPVRLQRASGGPSNEECLRLADCPPADTHADLATLERCSAVVVDDVELMADLGAAYESAHRPADAESVYRRAIALDPDYADLRARLAVLLLQRGAADEARAHLTAALRVQPNRRALLDLLDQASQVGQGRTP